jgi:predicted RND superfamily exporter protein
MSTQEILGTFVIPGLITAVGVAYAIHARWDYRRSIERDERGGKG